MTAKIAQQTKALKHGTIEIYTEEELAEMKRPEMPTLSAQERDKNFKEVELGFDEKMAMKEARRCLRCELETEEIE